MARYRPNRTETRSISAPNEQLTQCQPSSSQRGPSLKAITGMDSTGPTNSCSDRISQCGHGLTGRIPNQNQVLLPGGEGELCLLMTLQPSSRPLTSDWNGFQVLLVVLRKVLRALKGFQRLGTLAKLVRAPLRDRIQWVPQHKVRNSWHKKTITE